MHAVLSTGGTIDTDTTCVPIEQVDTITLTSSSIGNPIPVITWSKDGVDLPSTQIATSYFVDQLAQTLIPAMSVLTVSTSVLSGEDTFLCTGEVSVGDVKPTPTEIFITIYSYSKWFIAITAQGD